MTNVKTLSRVSSGTGYQSYQVILKQNKNRHFSGGSFFYGLGGGKVNRTHRLRASSPDIYGR